MTLRTVEPDNHMDQKTLIFVHLPKTAGSTLKSIIRRQYPADRTLVIQGEAILAQCQSFREQSPEIRKRLLCLIGHLPYGMHGWLPQGARYLTMLRHPVEWTLSFHSYIQRMPFFNQRPELAAFHGVRSLDLDGFVDFLVRSNMANLQTRAISGRLDLSNFLPPYEPLPHDALDHAKRNLKDKFDCVGTVERFDESLQIMRRKFGWRKIYYRRLNVGEGPRVRTELSRATLDRIVECNHMDIELHDEASRILSGEIEAAGEAFHRDLVKFRRMNNIYNRLLPWYEASGLFRLRRGLRRVFKVA